jgi:sigma-B regulation protein RsbU (phosphoserine phosphatase)
MSKAMLDCSVEASDAFNPADYVRLYRKTGMDRLPLKTQTAPSPRILIADDQPDVLAALTLLLKGEGFQSEEVFSPAAVLEALKTRDFDLLLMDLNYARDTTSGQEGLDLLSRVQAVDSTLPIVVMTAWGSIDIAIEVMRWGVRDFVLKPWENARLLDILRTQIEQGYAVRAKQRLEREQKQEFEEARRIQQQLLPKKMPSIPGYEITHVWRPAHTVGGDYMDVFKLSEETLALCIADVAGKGMPAALLMSNLQAVVKACASEIEPPQALCEKVNRVLCSNMSANKFITFFYGLLDVQRKRLVYVNAGHNAPILVHDDGSVVRLTEGGTVLGVMPEWRYAQEEIPLKTGDRMALFTDGIPESRNPDDEEFGEARVIELLVANRHLDAAALQEKIMSAVAAFSDGQGEDDETVIVISVD